MTPILPCHNKGSCATTFGWLLSTSISALLVSGLAAWAMASRDDGANSIGDMPIEITLISAPTAALEAMAEPAPDVAASAPSIETEVDAQDQPPLLPELAKALDLPDVPTPPDAPILEAEDVPQVESEVALPVAAKPPEPEPKPEPEVKPEVKPKPKQAEAKPKPKDKPQNKPKAEKKQAAAPDVAASKGASATQAASSQGGGQKAIANYGANVLKKVSRTKKRNAGARGQVVVGFKVAGNGGLESAWVINSSGKEKLDSVALDHIRRSAPFDPPPQGAQRSFSFTFVGK